MLPLGSRIGTGRLAVRRAMGSRRQGHDMPVSVGKVVVKIVFMVVLGIIFVAGSAMLIPRFQNYRMLSTRRAELEQKNLARQQELAALQRRQTRFRDDPELVEHIARQNKRVRPGEITFIFDVPAD
jgi:cell division protein FtsB